jgi:2,3-dihydroxybiphenyl 1,2-dioxygenase
MSNSGSSVLTDSSVFNKVHLGYLVIETEKFAEWRRFGRDAIGMHLDETLPGVMRFRLDDNECRFLLQRGPAEDTTALGWELDDHATFDTIAARITSHGVPLTEGTAEETALRGVERFVRFPGPNGLAQEMYVNAGTAAAPLSLGVEGGFITGVDGMGHVAIATKKPQQMRGYYNSVFDARLSDYIEETINGLKFKIRFLRVNERHHTIAIASMNLLPLNPIRTRVQHCNVQVADLNDMTLAYQRVKQLGFDMTLSVGQHTNDKELSFYAMTPSGFEWELGWNPIVVDESTWEPTTHQGISIWGHTQEGRAIVDLLAKFRTSARSALHREDVVPGVGDAGIPDD